MTLNAATLILGKRTHTIQANTSIHRALKTLNLKPDAYLITRDGNLITDDEMVKDGQVILLIPVISGG